MKNSTSAPNPFGLGAQLFGDISPSCNHDGSATTAGAAKVDDDEESSDDGDDDDDSASEKSLVTAMASASICDSASPWKAAPSHPTLYLSTVSEYISAPPRFKLPPGVQIIDPSEEDGKAGKDVSWFSESYENSLDVDQVFDKFSKRVENEPEQCVRYELKGLPLPFSSDATFKRLFPDPKQEPLPVTRPDFKVVHPLKRVYDASSIPKCPSCGGPRVFECQLMPNLINVFSTSSGNENLTDEQRRQAVEKALKKGDKDAHGSMEWGTCMVFSCENDCCLDEHKKESKEAWREEYVLIQWDV